MLGVPVHGGAHVTGAERVEGMAFTGIDLSDVLVEHVHSLGMTVEERGEGPAGTDGTELPVIADEDDLGSAGLGGGK